MIGQFVFSKAGRDKGALYVVVSQEGDFIYLCDGRLKTFVSPKKKRTKHIQPVNKWVESGLLARLTEGGQVRDEEIKFAIKRYKEENEKM